MNEMLFRYKREIVELKKYTQHDQVWSWFVDFVTVNNELSDH